MISSVHQLFAVFLLLVPSPVHGSMGSLSSWTIIPRNNNNNPSKTTPIPITTRTSASSLVPTIVSELGIGEEKNKLTTNHDLVRNLPRGGQDPEVFVRVIGLLTQFLLESGKAVLPPTVAVVRGVAAFYNNLPSDAIIAQVGLVYCFAGGYYPTLFLSLQAARQCGWGIMVNAIGDLTEEVSKAIEAASDTVPNKEFHRREILLRQTNIAFRTIDPMKINRAAGALYTTWLGVSAVLEKEYARIISMSMTLSKIFERVGHFLLEPPARRVVSKDHGRWVPVVIGWGCKAAAMNIAWRLQRILTASTSAMTGGLMFSRALIRMVSKKYQRIHFFGMIREDQRESPLDEIIGFMIAGLGFYTQMESQFKNGFSFKVPFPISLVTWPFDWAEKWIQWKITKD